MDSTRGRSHPGGKSLEDGISTYLRSIESGNFRRSADSVLGGWAAWVEAERGVSRVADVEVLDCRHYARHLKRLVREGELEASTARTYYATVRAFLGFCVDEELLDSNPAAARRAVDELPEETGDADRQFWGADERRQLLEFVDERARDALDGESETGRVTAYRDRAMVYLLALSGVRSGEILSDPADERRDGARWRDLDLDNGTLRVFGKSREYEHAQVPGRAVSVLERYWSVLEPATDEWPLFPSNHAPSLYRTVRTQLSQAGLSQGEIESLLDERDVDDLIRDRELVPPSLSKNGARSVVERLCEEAGVTVDGEPLKLHGARRGLGHELYRKGHAELAQTALRHSSIEVTHDSYADIKAGETADRVGEVLDEE